MSMNIPTSLVMMALVATFNLATGTFLLFGKKEFAIKAVLPVALFVLALASKNNCACKPSSVKNGHLSRHKVANVLKRYCEDRTGRPVCLPDLAPNGVYMTAQSPGRPCALTAHFHPYRRKTAVSFCCTCLGVASTSR